MHQNNYLFSSESVTEGHPDKLADQVSDAILDAIMEKDPQGRVAAETSVTTGLVLVCGEITTECYVDIPTIVRDTVKKIGYTRAKFGFDGETCAVLTSIDEQSPDIAQGVEEAYEVRGKEKIDEYDLVGAGDQGIMFGYACEETPELMPMPIALAHKMAQQLAKIRRDEVLDYLRPDGKTQVTVVYENGVPASLENVVVSAQHSDQVSLEQIEKDLIKHVVREIAPEKLITRDTRFFINPTGRFVVGGPQGDAGLTGRKTIVDTYGGYAAHGGGAYSGKDPTKVDRSASYAARYVAKNLVAAGLCSRCQLQLAYAIGVAHPVSMMVETYGTEKVPVKVIEEMIHKHFDLRPAAIIDHLQLRRPIYLKLAAYGHFGRPELDLPWERLDKVEQLKEALS
ncbi:MAG: methionine adenosyltransferase [Bacillota bacterium]